MEKICAFKKIQEVSPEILRYDINQEITPRIQARHHQVKTIAPWS
jgi:hypothetical protein